VRLAILTTHPVQYYAPLLRELARRVDLVVFYAMNPSPAQQAEGFGTSFRWDVDLTDGYEHAFLANVSARPHTGRFDGCDTPEIAERLGEGRFDAVLALGWHVKSQLQGIAAALRQGLAVLVRGDSQRGLQPSRARRAAKRVAYPLLLRAFRAALYVGHRNRAFYRHYGFPEARLFHSPHAVDTAYFAARATRAARLALRERLGVGEADDVVLFAGKLVPFKRPLDVVEAAALLRGRGRRVHLLVAGSGELCDALEALAEARGVPLHPLGFVNQSGMPAVHAAADVLALPSTGRETWGLVANEALACGTPIVVSDAAGCAPDLAGADAAGRVFPTGNVAALAAALEATLERPPGREAIRATSDAHGIDRAADGVLAALEATRR